MRLDTTPQPFPEALTPMPGEAFLDHQVPPASDSALDFARRHRDWYGHNRDRARRVGLSVEVLVLLLAAAATLAAALGLERWITAGLAAATLVLTGLRGIFNWTAKWISYSSAWLQLSMVVERYLLVPAGQRTSEMQARLLSRAAQVLVGESAEWPQTRRHAGEARE